MLPSRDEPSRRAFLRAAAGSGMAAFGWEAAYRIAPAQAAAADDPAPPDLPAGIEPYRQAYRNWCGEIRADDVWTCAPGTVADVVALANWARAQGWRLRAAGMRHGWAPLTVTPGADPRTLLVDLTRNMNRARIDGGPPASVTAQAGITMDDLLAHLEDAGYGMAACPAPGDLSLGGVLAIGGHGSVLPAAGEIPVAGHTYGTISNLIVSVTAVVWDSAAQSYVARTLPRDDPRAAALLVHLGRTLIVAATLRVGPAQRLRCVSRVDLNADVLFAPPATAGPDCFAAQLAASGRIETIWFPFTPAPWLKVWSVAPQKPATSRETDAPYNYPFADLVPEPVSALVKLVAEGEVWVTPLLTGAIYASVVAGLPATASVDLWGWAKNTQLYVKPSTLRLTANGYAVLTTRDRVQQVVSAFYDYLSATLERYRAEGRFPVNGPWEARATGLDDPADCGVPAARAAQLSAIRPRADHPYDTAVWFDVLTLPGTPDAQRFYADLEAWLPAAYHGPDAAVRPEWSKGWAYDGTAAWSDRTVLASVIPAAYRDGQASGDDWDAALETLDRLDPYRIYSNDFLDRLTPPTS
jgi:FAD/FMN-containing dehydrogenase